MEMLWGGIQLEDAVLKNADYFLAIFLPLARLSLRVTFLD